MSSQTPVPPSSPLYYLGCPVWSCGDWRGTVFPKSAPRQSWLRHYSQTFGTVEGNSTFYAIPAAETFERWATQVQPGFRFALKFPRVITHEKVLQNARAETDLFLDGLQIMQRHGCLGPAFIQFSDRFPPARFADLASYLRDLPREFPFAVEVRDHDFFTEPHESRLNDLIAELGMDRVLFDSRPLFSAPAEDEHEVQSRRRKPRTPIRHDAIGRHPFLRFVGRNRVSAIMPWVREWAPLVASWIQQGKTPFVFAHAPDDRRCPDVAWLMHREIARHHRGLPAELEFPNQARQQLDLF